ncbi:FAD-binding domain-containing protein [Hymenopellis radicata]|nr:FAD-binding domain-containing protein [Hymenopellis radicata]
MARIHFLLAVFALAETTVQALPDACQLIQDAVSNSSDVHYPGSDNYTRDVYHWSEASMQPSLCSVEPGTTEDVGKILQILGSTQTRFAVKAGGHAANPGFSDTDGVQIALTRFSQIEYDASSQIVAVGAGLLWDEVYDALEPYGVNVVGGRVPGVGVAGFALGGGYSWLTNEHGLTLDTIVELELVEPSGKVSSITRQSDPDLFFALKGTQNNFGIVTKIVLQTYPQGQVWGGLITYSGDQVDGVNAALIRFSQEVTDPKAALVVTYVFVAGQMTVDALTFYNAATPPAGLFDDFLNIPSTGNDANQKSFRDLIASFSASGDRPNNRTTFHTVPMMEHSAAVLDAFVNESMFWGTHLSQDAPDAFIAYGVEPFLSNVFSHNAESTAYPPSRQVALFPDILEFGWSSEASDDLFFESIRQSAAHLTNVAADNGQAAVRDASPYPNYALYDVPVERIFGNNLKRLREIKARVDPHDVMALTGGFRL